MQSVTADRPRAWQRAWNTAGVAVLDVTMKTGRDVTKPAEPQPRDRAAARQKVPSARVTRATRMYARVADGYKVIPNGGQRRTLRQQITGNATRRQHREGPGKPKPTIVGTLLRRNWVPPVRGVQGSQDVHPGSFVDFRGSSSCGRVIERTRTAWESNAELQRKSGYIRASRRRFVAVWRSRRRSAASSHRERREEQSSIIVTGKGATSRSCRGASLTRCLLREGGLLRASVHRTR